MLAVNAVVHGIKNSVDDLVGDVLGLCAFLVYTGLDEDRVPGVLAVLVVLVGATNVGFRSVANEVYGLRWLVDAMCSLAPLPEKTSGELKRANLRLAEGSGDKLFAGYSLEHSLERAAERTHAKASEIVRRGPDDVVVGEEDWRSFVEVFRASVEAAALRQKQIKNDLLVTCPISAVGEHENGLDHSGRPVAVSRVVPLFLGQLPERCGVRVGFDDIARSHDIFEAIALGHVTALLTLTTDDEDGLVLVGHLSHGSVATDELTGRDLDLHLLTELNATFLLGFAATVGNEDVWAAGISGDHVGLTQCTYILMPYLFFPFRACMASTASGMGRPPRIKTPSMSNAKANLSVTVVSGGVSDSEGAPSESSRSNLANSIAAATSWASLGSIRCCGGTMTVGPPLKSAVVASLELSLRKVRGLLGGTMSAIFVFVFVLVVGLLVVGLLAADWDQ